MLGLENVNISKENRYKIQEESIIKKKEGIEIFLRKTDKVCGPDFNSLCFWTDECVRAW